MSDLLGIYSDFIHISRYARWLEDKGRRETWEETVQRYIDFFANRLPDHAEEIKALYDPIVSKEVMPSMRALMTAGKALELDELAGFNCSFAAVDHIRVFDEAVYILCCGVGLGFSVENKYVSKLPEVAEELHPSESVIVVPDSKVGWATSFRELISLLYAGKIPKWDMSRIRPAGAKLKVFGGRASGKAPLERLFNFTVNTFKKAAGRKLTSLECHDLMCMIGEVVVSGGVRRSAEISFSDLSDDKMSLAKSGQWWVDTGHRAMANNSAVYDGKPDVAVFMREWQKLYESKSGERGIFNRAAATKKVEALGGKRDSSYSFGGNPCMEILLRPNGVCNLSEVVIRDNDSLDTLKRKVAVASILGTIQSTMTGFRYVRKVWKQNAEEERLLGVSLTGIMDHSVMSGKEGYEELQRWLLELKQVVIDTNAIWAEKLGIPVSAATTAVKPSGTISQLVNSSSGIHARFAPYYIRRVRADKKDPLYQFMVANGFPGEQDAHNPNSWVFEFPIKAPKDSVMVKDLTAIQQLEIWKMYSQHWCEHNPSCTIYYSDDEFLKVGAWVYENFDNVLGLSFLPRTDHVYVQAPYEEITEAKYAELLAKMPTSVDWKELAQFESEDNTKGSQELACSAGVCEIVDI